MTPQYNAMNTLWLKEKFLLVSEMNPKNITKVIFENKTQILEKTVLRLELEIGTGNTTN